MTPAPAGPELVDRLVLRLPAMLEDLEALVTAESPSADLAALDRCADAVAGVGRRLTGVDPERLVVAGRTHLRWRFGDPAGPDAPDGVDGPPRVLLLGHYDTVWSLGSLARHPYRLADGTVTGPGCFDMKAGLVQLFHALSALADSADSGDLRGVRVLVTGDEEIGSPTSRALIEAEARGAAAALVLEASADGGALKTARKGSSWYEVQVLGRAAHAGLEPERGVNAGVELAHQVLALADLADPSAGTTVTPTVLAAGTTANTVPAGGSVAVDVRAASAAEQQRVDRDLRRLRPRLAGTSLAVTGGPNRPPLPVSASAGLLARAQRLTGPLGLPPVDGVAVGGGSDGNFTAAVGTPTLDGLGAVGGGAHAANEHVVAAELPRRTALLAALVADLFADVRRAP